MSDTETAPAAAPVKKGRSKLLIIGVPVLLLLIGGGAGAWWHFSQPVEGAEAPPPEPPGLVTFEPFVVNLTDPGGRRFLRVSLRLLVAGEDVAAELEENELEQVKARSAILELLATQTSATLITPEGKSELKKAIAERVTHALGHVEVTDVLFAEFVVQ